MIGMLQIITYLLCVYLVYKGWEILQIALMSNRENRKVGIVLGVVAVVGSFVASSIFVYMIDRQANSVSGGPVASAETESPNSVRSNVAANERSAVGSLRTLQTAAVTYASTYPSIGFPASIAALGPVADGGAPSSTSADFVDRVLASGTKSGYSFTYTPSTTTPPINSYTIVAVPVSRSTGQRKFFTDESGVIRETTDGSNPTVASTPLR